MEINVPTLWDLLERAFAKGYARGVLGHIETFERDQESALLEILKAVKTT